MQTSCGFSIRPTENPHPHCPSHLAEKGTESLTEAGSCPWSTGRKRQNQLESAGAGARCPPSRSPDPARPESERCLMDPSSSLENAKHTQPSLPRRSDLRPVKSEQTPKFLTTPPPHAVAMAMGKYCAGEELWEYESAEPAKGPLENRGSQRTCRVFRSAQPTVMDGPLLPTDAGRPARAVRSRPAVSGPARPLLFSRKALALCEQQDRCLATQACGYRLASRGFKHFPLPSGTNDWC